MKRIKRPILVLILAAVLISFIILTNPSILPLPQAAKDWLYNVWSGTFGNVEEITKTVKVNWVTVFQIIAIVLVLALVYNIAKWILDLVKPKTGRGRSIHSMLGSFLIYTVALIGLVWVLAAIGVNISTIFASIGIVALVIGFAAESLIEDIITGLFLVFEDEFNVGDIIEYNGFRGTVTKIGVRVTCIEDVGGNIKIVNNSDIRNVMNKSKSPSAAVTDAPISYSADLEAAEAALKEILKSLPEKYPDVFAETPSYLGVQTLDASSVNLRVCANVKEADVFNAKRLLNREIKIGLDKAGIEIPFQQVVIHNAAK